MYGVSNDVVGYDFYYKDFCELAKQEVRRDARNRFYCAHEANIQSDYFSIFLYSDESVDGRPYIFLFERERGHFVYIDYYKD